MRGEENLKTKITRSLMDWVLKNEATAAGDALYASHYSVA